MKKNIQFILKTLDELYPEIECPLEHRDPFQLLIATILSAQCTDKQVNKISPALFAQFPNAQAFANGSLEDIEKAVSSVNYYKNKAKNIQACSKMLLEKFNGIVPHTLEELILLPGVGRKTANVILGDAFQIPGVVVDTHVKRLSKRLGLTVNDDVHKIELDLQKIIPQEKWTHFSLQLIFLGRQFCIARSPQCFQCPLAKVCPSKSTSKSKKE